MEAAQLIDVADVIGVEEHRRLVTARAGNPPALTTLALELERLPKIPLDLNPALHQLHVKGAQECSRLAQDGDDLGGRDQFGDAGGRGRGGEVEDGGLAHPLPRFRVLEQLQVLLQ